MRAVRVLVVGAGVGGLTCAVAMQRAGYDVSVFEQASALRAAGSGLTLWPRAMSVVRSLGLEEAVAAVAQPVEALAVMAPDGTSVARLPLTEATRAWGASAVNVGRAELLSALAAQVRPGSIRTGMQCTDVHSDAGGVSVGFADGSTADGDVLVGADGVGSAVRGVLHGRSSKPGRRYRAWVGISTPPPGSVSERTSTGMLGSALVMLLPLAGGRVHWFLEPGFRRWPPAPASRDAVALAAWLDAAPPAVRDTIAATPDEEYRFIDVRDRLVSSPWGRGRVTLLGDAAHAMLPVLGRGACEAVEDVAVLARQLREVGDVPTALRCYEQHRAVATARYVRSARRAALLRQVTGMAAPMLRRLPPAAIQRGFARQLRVSTQ